jgi:predicted NAD/FAD-binding protein
MPRKPSGFSVGIKDGDETRFRAIVCAAECPHAKRDGFIPDPGPDIR